MYPCLNRQGLFGTMHFEDGSGFAVDGEAGIWGNWGMEGGWVVVGVDFYIYL